jgi:hypothetical protein
MDGSDGGAVFSKKMLLQLSLLKLAVLRFVVKQSILSLQTVTRQIVVGSFVVLQSGLLYCNYSVQIGSRLRCEGGPEMDPVLFLRGLFLGPAL